MLDRHGLIGLVHASLTKTYARVPSQVLETIQTRAIAQATTNLALAAESVHLQRKLDGAGLEATFLKGGGLAVQAYGDLGLRCSNDIDILVDLASLPRAIAVIKDAGYTQFDPSPDLTKGQTRLILSRRKDLGFVHSRSGVHLELHWRLFPNPHSIDERALSRQWVSIGGSTKLRVLADEDLLSYLCLHGAYHSWNQLKWLADVAALLNNLTHEEIEKSYQAAEARGADLAAGQAMLLCRRLFDVSLPPSLLARLISSRRVRWLEKAALKGLGTGNGFDDPHEIRFGTTLGSMSALLLGNSWRYYREELRHLLTNEGDIAAVPLPRWLQFLYPVLRLPFWIARHLRLRFSLGGQHHFF